MDALDKEKKSPPRSSKYKRSTSHTSPSHNINTHSAKPTTLETTSSVKLDPLVPSVPKDKDKIPAKSPPAKSPGRNRKIFEGEDEIVYLNIGGYTYVTKKSTLCDPERPNYFTPLLEGVFPVTRDNKGYIFIDRPGKYFAPILEYLITGEVIVPRDLSVHALVNEAAFYCIDFPLDETHESLSFVTDSWLLDRFENRAYLKIAHIADVILAIVLKQFKEKADKSLKIESSPFLINDLTPVNRWLDQTEYGREYKRFEFIDQQKKLYSQDCIVNDEYFALLDDSENRMIIVNYCLHNDLTLDIVPVSLNIPGVVGEHGSYTFGYKFVHLPRTDKKKYYKKRLSLGRDPCRIESESKVVLSN